jgi:hypothetical protein
VRGDFRWAGNVAGGRHRCRPKADQQPKLQLARKTSAIDICFWSERYPAMSPQARKAKVRLLVSLNVSPVSRFTGIVLLAGLYQMLAWAASKSIKRLYLKVQRQIMPFPFFLLTAGEWPGMQALSYAASITSFVDWNSNIRFGVSPDG